MNDRIKVHRSTPSNDGALGAQNTTRLTIDLDGQYSSIAVEGYVDAIDILNQVMHGKTSPSALKDDGLPLSLSDATRNAKNFLIQAKMLAKALNEIISSGDWLTVHDMAEWRVQNRRSLVTDWLSGRPKDDSSVSTTRESSSSPAMRSTLPTHTNPLKD